MKHLYLLSFSLAFLTKGIADDPFKDNNHVDEDYDQYASFEEDDAYVADAESTSQPMQPQADETCCSPYHNMRAGIRVNENRGIGYEDGYTTLEAFGIYDQWSSDFMPFFDVRGHVFNNGKLAGNLGIGGRTILPSINHTFGAYFYYGVRRVGPGLTVNQLSPGLELVGEQMEYRINGYFPVGNEKGHKSGFEFEEFEGNNILLKFKQYHAMRGADAELGVHLKQSTDYDVYLAEGAYYFRAPHASSWGGKTRLLARYKEYVSVEAAYSYDHLFGGRLEGIVSFSMPFGNTLKRTGRCCQKTDDLLLSRASFAPSRFEIPVVKKIRKKERAINPATGLPWTVWFVNNTSSSAGTYESPYPTLALAELASSTNDMIYVFPGNGSAYNETITLKDGQAFFGSGINQQFASTKGTMTIPAFSASYPTVSNGATVVTLGNSNAVSGFNILASGGQGGIYMPLALTNGAVIQNNNITVTGNFNGITVGTLLTGVVDISSNRITASGSNGEGILLQLTNTQQASVSQNTISGFSIGFDLEQGGSSPYALQLNRNIVTNFANGFLLNTSRNATINVSENIFSTTTGTGACIENRDVLSSSINNNTMTTTGIGIEVLATSSSGIGYRSNIFNNNVTITGGGTFGIRLRATGADSLCASITDNLVTTTATGLSITTSGAGSINVDSLEGNIRPNVVSSGNVNLVAPGTCSP